MNPWYSLPPSVHSCTSSLTSSDWYSPFGVSVCRSYTVPERSPPAVVHFVDPLRVFHVAAVVNGCVSDRTSTLVPVPPETLATWTLSFATAICASAGITSSRVSNRSTTRCSAPPLEFHDNGSSDPVHAD